ncbi:MAG: hypothetical protein ABIS06_13770 [Vicinamibacterales bacterium]
MLPAKVIGPCSRAWIKRGGVTLVVAIALLALQPQGQAQTSSRPPLKLFKNYFLAGGDYAVGGVGLRGSGNTTTGLATGNITLSGVDDAADISAAFLYWASLEPNDTLPMSSEGFFRGAPISGKMISGSARVPACWGSGGGAGVSSSTTQLRVYRADVLKNFAVSTAPATAGKLLVNGIHQVMLPDSGGGGTQAPSSGNQVKYVEGASLVVVSRIATQPLRSVVIYDGGFTVDQDVPAMSVNVGGYYDATGTPNAKMTHMVGDGGSRPEILTVNGAIVGGSNPFSGALGSAWDNPTYDVPGTVLDLGVPTGLSFASTNIDCLSWAGVLLRTDVQDTDADGIPDRVEDGTAVVPDGEPALPNFPALGASPTVPDLFVELGFFKSTGWGGTSGVGAHDHRPSANALGLAGRAFKRAGITAHFDIGPDDDPLDDRYPAPLNPLVGGCTTLATWTLGCAIIPATQATGGEFVTEATCGSVSTAPCQFPNYPGTVGWKSGYQYYRDAPVTTSGTQLTATDEAAWEQSCEASGACPPRRRFDANRMNFFHYSLWAHALGLPKESCLNTDGTANTICQQTNPDFHVPVRSSGFGDVGGADSLITLGGFGFNFNASDIAQAGTFMHELGHNSERRHGGESLERNCKPNYISVMSYLFQVHGMNGGTDVDFSGAVLNPIDESTLADGPMVGAAYAPRWYAPLATSYVHRGLSVTPVAKHCDGTFVNAATEAPMVRVDATLATASIDWLNDGGGNTGNSFFDSITGAYRFSDVNFDGNHNPTSPAAAAPGGPLNGSNDWLVIRSRGLRQLASRPNMGLASLDMSVADLGRGDPGRGDPGRGDPGRGDPGRGDPGRGDPGRGDPGRGDPGRGDPGAPPDQGDLTLEHANAIFNGPYALTAAKVAKTVVLNWQAPQVMLPGVTIVSTTAYRVQGATITPANWANRVQVGLALGSATSIIDVKPLSNKQVTYVVVVDFSDGTRSGISNTVTITYP